MDAKENTMTMFSGFGYKYEMGKPYCGSGANFWHPGFAWAMTRRAYETLGGLFDLSVLGSGDHQMALAFIGEPNSINVKCSQGYKDAVVKFVNRAKNIRLGYTPGVIKHYYHGSKTNRRYHERWQILTKHQYDPEVHVSYDKNGLLVPTAECPVGMLEEILEYFKERKEDD
jgi:hypothetical protein